MVDWEDFYGSFRQPGFLAGYEIQNHLGGGAFGEVYKARKTSIGKAYAIKFLRLDGGDGRAAAERELEQVRHFASIDHPNLVTIEDMGVVRDVPYLIMGYAGEDTLARRIQRRELTTEEALRTFVQACRGVLALHDRRLAHFDLKPGNVFLNGDVARVGDYGLAKLLSEGRQTLSFGRGTPHYMAPEMLKSRADHRADVYSLGVILFECLAFRLPFGDVQENGIVREEDDPPDFPADFPVRLRGVVERCLRLDPGLRYGTVRELLEDMGQTARQGDSIRLDPLDPSEEPRPRRPPLRSAALAAEELAAEEPVRPGLREQLGQAEGELREAGSDLRQAGGDLRQAAAELARGAVGVARGVWSGVSERVTSSDGDTPASAAANDESSRERSAYGADVMAVSGLRDEPLPEEVTRSSRVVTVPVPPRADGGWIGNLTASIVLGAEVLGALVTGPVLALLRRIGSGTEGLVRRIPGTLGFGLRLGLLLLALAFLGGLCSFVILALTTLEL